MMRLLLDTHALIWWWKDDPRLPARARSAMGDEANTVFVSAASGWEIATKVRNGQMPEMLESLPTFEDDLADDRFRQLAVTMRHGLDGGSLPGSHKDPFDRLLAAQALGEDLTIITRDAAFSDFGCKTLW